MTLAVHLFVAASRKKFTVLIAEGTSSRSPSSRVQLRGFSTLSWLMASTDFTLGSPNISSSKITSKNSGLISTLSPMASNWPLGVRISVTSGPAVSVGSS